MNHTKTLIFLTLLFFFIHITIILIKKKQNHSNIYWKFSKNTKCGCIDGNKDNWTPSNIKAENNFDKFWIQAPRNNINICKNLCAQDKNCNGFQWTKNSNQISDKNVCWFRKNTGCNSNFDLPEVCEELECKYHLDRDCYTKYTK